MSSRSKKIVVAVAVVIIAVSTWIIREKLEKTRREGEHNAVLAIYQHDLPQGTIRADVDRYLASRNAAPLISSGELLSDAPSYWIFIDGQPGDGVVCKSWNIYVSLEFKPSGWRQIPLPGDMLREIHIRQSGRCL